MSVESHVTDCGDYVGHDDDCHQIGRQAERERIIALLKRYANTECDEHCSYVCECYGKYEAQHFIALIKGENK